MKKVIIVGASSGMGRELAVLYAKKNCNVGITGRRKNLLEDLQSQFPQNIFIQPFDNTQDDVAKNLRELIEKLDGLDLMIISSGTGYLNPELDHSVEKQTIDLNVTAWTAIAGFAFNFFKKQNRGQLVAITSIAAIRGEGRAPAYNASKAFQASYLQGLRKKTVLDKLRIHITDVQPGFVETSMAKSEVRFWEATPAKAAKQIFFAIESKRKKVYITKRWWLIAQVLKLTPDWIYNRL
jgi:short-subunit dehydrogenase